MLLVVLTLWKHAIGYPSEYQVFRVFRDSLGLFSSLVNLSHSAGLGSQQVHPRSLRNQKSVSPRGFRFSVLDASVPVNVLAVKSPSSSQLSQFGTSSSYESMSQTQSSPSGSVSTFWVLPQNPLQGFSSSNVQGMASQSAGGPGSYNQYDFTYKDRTKLKAGGSGQLVSAQGGISQATPESFSEVKFVPFDVLGQSGSDKSLSSASSQSGSGLQLGGMSSQLYSQPSGASQFGGASGQYAAGSAKLLPSSGKFTSQLASREASPSQYTPASQDSSRSQFTGSSSHFVAAPGGSASLSGLSLQSLSASSQYTPMSSAYPSLGSLPMAVSGPSSDKTSQFSFSSGSQAGSSQLAASQLSGLVQGASSYPVGSYVQSQGSPSKLAFGSPQYAGASRAAAQSNQASVQSPSQSQISQRWQPSASRFSQGSLTSAAVSQSRFSAPSAPAPSKFSSSYPSKSASASLLSSASMASPQAVSGQYSQTTDGAFSLSQSQASQRWQPSVSSFSQGSLSSGAALSPSRFSAASAPAPSKSLASAGRPSQIAPASLYSSASAPSSQTGSSQYSQAVGSVLSLSQSQAPQRWQPSASLSSKGFQTSSTAVSQSSAPSQVAKFPSRFSMASGSGPSQLLSTQGASSYGGLAQSPSSSAHYVTAYSKPASAPMGVTTGKLTRPSLYASSSQSMAGASSRYASAQRGIGSNVGSLQPQVAAGQYAPASLLDVKVPTYSQASSGSSMSSRLQSPTWQPTSSRRVDGSFATSGAAVMQTSSSPQSVQSSSRFSSMAGGSSRLLSTQSRGSYTGSSQALGTVGRYAPAYAKFGASSLGVSSQSTSGQSFSSQYSPLSTIGSGGQLTSSSGSLSAQGGSGPSVGSSFLSQGALTKETLAPLDTSMPVASQAAAVSSGFQASGVAAFQSGSPQASRGLSALPALSAPVAKYSEMSGSASSQMSPGLLISAGQPTGSMTPSSGSSVQAASEGMFSASSQPLSGSTGFGASAESLGLSGGSAVFSGSSMSGSSGSFDSSFGQSAPVSKASRGSLSRYYGVKG